MVFEHIILYARLEKKKTVGRNGWSTTTRIIQLKFRNSRVSELNFAVNERLELRELLELNRAHCTHLREINAQDEKNFVFLFFLSPSSHFDQFKTINNRINCCELRIAPFPLRNTNSGGRLNWK